MSPWGAALCALAIAGSLATGWPQAARAATCQVPPASAQAARQATPAANQETGAGIIQVEGDAATPASLPAATPVAAALDPLVILTDDLLAVSQSLAACLSAGEVETVTELANERYLGQLFGSSVPLSSEEFIAVAATLTPVPTRIVTLDNVTQTDDGRATAIVTQVVGNQLMRAEWTFAQVAADDRPAGSNPWQLVSERQLPVEPPRGAPVIAVEIGEASFDLDPERAAGPEVVLRGENVATVDHEMLVVRLENGATTDDLLRAAGPNLPENITFVAELPVRAGRESDLVLTDLDPGVYTIVCLFPNAEGLPYLVEGMEASFTIE